jgi:hypothetical protein
LRTHLRPDRFLAGGIVGQEVEKILRREILAESVNASRKEELLYLRNGSAFRLPDSGKIGFAIESRRRRGQIRFALSRTRNGRIPVHGPLGVNV